MGWYHSKCHQCWDAIPCQCEAQQEREGWRYSSMAIQNSGQFPQLNVKMKPPKKSSKKGGKR